MPPAGWCELVLVLVLATAAFDTKTNYCDSRLCKEPKHSYCRFPAPGPGSTCRGYVSAPITNDEQRVILDGHNQLRSLVARGKATSKAHGVQPSAANMLQLEWSSELADLAQRWADQCTIHHDCRNMPTLTVGQNILVDSSTRRQNYNYTVRIGRWFREINKFDPAWVKQYPKVSKTTGHYTQLVWGTSRYLGCARSIFNSQTFKGWISDLLVCNYGPAGNTIGVPVYKAGDACSACSLGATCSAAYQGLCVVASE